MMGQAVIVSVCPRAQVEKDCPALSWDCLGMVEVTKLGACFSDFTVLGDEDELGRLFRG